MSRPEKEEARVWRFGGFTLDPIRRGLYRGGERIHLTPKPLETLIYLVERHGRTVEKHDLLDAIWNHTAVTEDTLVQAVGEIRRALRDDKADPHFIQTVPRRGYRFVADVIAGSEFAEGGGSASLTPVLSPAPIHDGPAAWGEPAARRRRRIWSLAAFGTLTAAAALAIPVAVRYASRSGPGLSTVLEQLTPEGMSAGKPAFSAEGNILYNSGGALFIRPAGSDTALQITDRILPSGDMPVFTADGGHVVFSLPRNGEDGSRVYDLYTVDAIGGRPSILIAEASGAGFSPDGKWIAYTKHLPDGPVLWISAVEQLDRHVEVRPRGFVPRWSPDGRWIAYTTADPNATEGELWMASVSPSAGGELLVSDHTRLTNEPQAMYGLSWTADGRSVVFAARRAGGPMHLYRVWTSGGKVAALTSGAGDYACPSVSPDGTRVMFWHGTPVKNLMVVDGPGSPGVEAITDDEYHLWPALSPSATHIASVVRRPTYQEHLYVTEIGTRKRVSLSARPARHPTWIDDETVAYLEVTESGPTAVRLVKIAAGSKPLTLTELPPGAAWLAVHPGRTAVAFVVGNGDERQRIVLRQSGGRARDRTLAYGGEYEHLRWLPDGSTLSWSGSDRSPDAATNGIWLMEVDRSAPRRIVADGYGPVWTADGTAVYFSKIREYAGLWKYDLRTRQETEVRRWQEEEYEFDIVGERLVYTMPAGRGRIFAMSLDR